MRAVQERLAARVVGRVQGVGFRWWAVQQAEELGLTGWVTNADDERTVEIVAEGTPEALEELERRLWQGPPGARVERVEARREPASGEFTRFGIVRG
ncbi:MAG TPA: acylphosphatase [Candidatus Limnocylindria bacterium]|nr:acylphosphatase [Candidatus Limnocylindria bacterium]